MCAILAYFAPKILKKIRASREKREYPLPNLSYSDKTPENSNQIPLPPAVPLPEMQNSSTDFGSISKNGLEMSQSSFTIANQNQSSASKYMLKGPEVEDVEGLGVPEGTPDVAPGGMPFQALRKEKDQEFDLQI